MQCTVLPPLDRRPRALAAASCLAGALGAREELCHKLRDVRKLGVGAQHVHGLFNLLQRQQKVLMVVDGEGESEKKEERKKSHV